MSDALSERIGAWIAEMMPRALVDKQPEHDVFAARIPGLRSVYATAFAESAALVELEHQLRTYAGRTLAEGKPLPRFSTPRIQPPTEIRKAVRISSIKRLLLERHRTWGGVRQALPVGSVDDLLNDIDTLVNRHAAAMANPH